jgi:heavy metal translocating P-type ATPase
VPGKIVGNPKKAARPEGSVPAWRNWLYAGWLPLLTLCFIVIGAVARFGLSNPDGAELLWWVGLGITGIPTVAKTAREMSTGRFAVDLVAALAIILAFILWQPLAGLVIVLMQSGGESLERYAGRKASDAVRQLEAAAPRIAHRMLNGSTEDVTVDEVEVGDLLLIRPGDLVPCDGIVIAGRSHVDAAKLTGEPIPISAVTGVRLMSGSINLDGPLELEVLAPAGESQYARIVELVRSAQASKAPLQRLADRYGLWFTPLTLAVCAIAYALTHDPVRVLAILVVATPCPLLLAAPVAFISGINAAARRHVIMRNGSALEHLASATAAVFDKTGTVTLGRPIVRRVIAAGPLREVDILRLAGAVEHGSSHLLARTLVEAAEESVTQLPSATEVREEAGRGVSGIVENHAVSVGAASYAADHTPSFDAEMEALKDQGHGLRAYVTVDNRLAGIVEYNDAVRTDIAYLLDDLRSMGVSRTLLLSGDQSANVHAVAQHLGIREAAGDLLPQEKVRVVRDLVDAGEHVLMIGDGTNDAPALSAATVGIALAAQSGGITAEAADVVILADDLLRISEAIRISRRTMRIAKQSIWVGLGLSATAAGFAAAGMIAPTIGALLQEVIDLAVIVNALRATILPDIEQRETFNSLAPGHTALLSPAATSAPRN